MRAEISVLHAFHLVSIRRIICSGRIVFTTHGKGIDWIATVKKGKNDFKNRKLVMECNNAYHIRV